MLHDSRNLRTGLLFVLTTLFWPAVSGEAAQYRTTNFVVEATSERDARLIGEAAEHFRRELALEWTGRVMPKWSKPCPITTKIGNIGAGGATTFSFDRGEVFGWRMNVQGTLERILDSVIPHEVCHTVFACHFRRPLPRWADEGAATLTEHESEKRRQTNTLNQVIRTSRRIPLRRLLSMKEYPKDMKDVLTLYAEGYALADLLVQEGGKSRYLTFLSDANKIGWDQALRKHYRYESVEQLERRWSDWVIAGSPAVTQPDTLVASNSSATTTRGQSAPLEVPNRETPAALGRPNSGLIDSSLREFGEPVALGPAGAMGAVEATPGDGSTKLSRGRLVHPLHQVSANATPYQAFRRRELFGSVAGFGDEGICRAFLETFAAN